MIWHQAQGMHLPLGFPADPDRHVQKLPPVLIGVKKWLHAGPRSSDAMITAGYSTRLRQGKSFSTRPECCIMFSAFVKQFEIVSIGAVSLFFTWPDEKQQVTWQNPPSRWQPIRCASD